MGDKSGVGGPWWCKDELKNARLRRGFCDRGVSLRLEIRVTLHSDAKTPPNNASVAIPQNSCKAIFLYSTQRLYKSMGATRATSRDPNRYGPLQMSSRVAYACVVGCWNVR